MFLLNTPQAAAWSTINFLSLITVSVKIRKHYNILLACRVFVKLLCTNVLAEMLSFLPLRDKEKTDFGRKTFWTGSPALLIPRCWTRSFPDGTLEVEASINMWRRQGDQVQFCCFIIPNLRINTSNPDRRKVWQSVANVHAGVDVWSVLHI